MTQPRKDKERTDTKLKNKNDINTHHMNTLIKHPYDMCPTKCKESSRKYIVLYHWWNDEKKRVEKDNFWFGCLS